MQIIQNLTNDAKQKHTISLANGKRLVLELMFFATQNAWYGNINYNDSEFVLNGFKIVSSPNILYQYQNIIDFGLSCECEGFQEPMFVDDFLVGRASLSIITQEEFVNVNTILESSISG